MNDNKPAGNVSKLTVASVTAGMLAIFVALEKWPGAEQFVVFWLGVIERVFTHWLFVIGAPAILFGGLCGVAYPWFMKSDITKALAERRLRIASALLTFWMGLVITWYLERRLDGVILSAFCSIGGPMVSTAALHWLMIKLKIVPAALVPTRQEVAAMVGQIVAAETLDDQIIFPSHDGDTL